ncbi:MAG: response regulator [Blautia sp.]|nr:response regulator [Blautia sp.]MCM1201242.1 response regulator [Bacteroides fragilis]
MYRILVADDEPIERRVMSKKIREFFPEQTEVFLAENGREAIEIFEREGCDIVIIDIEMPGMNGLDAAERIRGMDRDCSIIFLTAFDEFNYAKKAISVKALEYLLKPGNDEEITVVLEEAFRIADERKKKQMQKRTAEEEKSEREIFDGTHSEEIRMNVVAEEIRSYIADHYKEDLSLQDVAGAMRYSDAYFCKIFKKYFNRSFIVYLNELRIEKAKPMLEDAVRNIKDISSEVGYRDSNYFAKVFKRLTGMTPSDYRGIALQKKRKQSV